MHFFSNANPDTENLICALIPCVHGISKEVKPGYNSSLVSVCDYVVFVSYETTKTCQISKRIVAKRCKRHETYLGI